MPQQRPTTNAPETDRIISAIAETCRSSRTEAELPEIIRRIYRDKLAQHPDGHMVPIAMEQDVLNSAALHRVVQAIRPTQAVEIGMAYALSTLSILTAMESNKQGNLISIDPYIGLPKAVVTGPHQVKLAGLAARHTLIQDFSQYAMPRMITEKYTADLVYIDGHHGVEYVMADAFFSDKMLRPGGVIGFNDVGWRGVHKTIAFLTKYRDYREVNVGLPLTFNGRNVLSSVVRRWERRSNFDRYFVKNSDWERDAYVSF